MVTPMNYFKKFVVLLITSSIILLNAVNVNADLRIPTPQEELQFYRDIYNESVTEGGYQSWLKRLSKKAFDNVGFLIDETGITIQKIKDAIHGVDSNQSSDMTDEEAYDWIKDNISVSDNNIVFGDQFNQFVKNYESDYVNDHPAIGYTFTLSEVASKLTVASVYDALYELMKDDGDIQGIIYVVNFYNQYTNVWKFTQTERETERLYCTLGTVTNVGVNNARISGGRIVSLNTPGINYKSVYYSYSNDDKKFLQRENTTATVPAVSNYLVNYVNGRVGTSTINSANFVISKNYRVPFKIFSGTPTVSDYMYSPYYYNNDVWQDFSTSSGDYTLSPSNINTVSYGDTITYIDNYNDDNGNPPTLQDININIENTNNNNVNGGSGGGSGDGSGGNGGGSGSGNDGIFNFLSDLGSVLGNLISNLGQAITNIIKGISDLVTSIVTDLPTVFFDFVGSIFGWLPEEWVTLLSLSLAAMLIWGIVKVIRG